MCKIIDYSKPIKSDLDEGNRAKKIIEIIQTKPSKYDAKKEAKKSFKKFKEARIANMMTFFEELTSKIDINAKINLNKCASIYLIIN